MTASSTDKLKHDIWDFASDSLATIAAARATDPNAPLWLSSRREVVESWLWEQGDWAALQFASKMGEAIWVAPENGSRCNVFRVTKRELSEEGKVILTKGPEITALHFCVGGDTVVCLVGTRGGVDEVSLLRGFRPRGRLGSVIEGTVVPPFGRVVGNVSDVLAIIATEFQFRLVAV